MPRNQGNQPLENCAHVQIKHRFVVCQFAWTLRSSDLTTKPFEFGTVCPFPWQQLEYAVARADRRSTWAVNFLTKSQKYDNYRLICLLFKK